MMMMNKDEYFTGAKVLTFVSTENYELRELKENIDDE